MADAYQFGPFVFTPGEGSLILDGEPLVLAEPCFELLHILLEHAGSEVSAPKLAAWTGVSEQALADYISQLKSTLISHSDCDIEASQSGFRFRGDVSVLEANQPDVWAPGNSAIPGKPFTAYRGPDEFVFVCYAHEDSARVYPELIWLAEQGIRLWYDEGIAPGKNWRAAIGDALLRAQSVLFFVSSNSLQSDHCNREINLALDEEKAVLPIFVEDIELTPDLRVGLGRIQALRLSLLGQHRQALLEALTDQPRSLPAEQAAASRKSRRYGSAAVLSLAVCGVLLAAFFYGSSDVQEPGLENGQIQIVDLPFAVDLSSIANEINSANVDCENHVLRYASTRETAHLEQARASCSGVSIKAEGSLVSTPRLDAGAGLAYAYLIAGKPETAIEVIDRLDGEVTTYEPVLTLSALARQTLGSYDEAEQLLRRAIAENEFVWRTHLALGSFLAEVGRYQDASFAYEQAQERLTNDLSTMLNDGFGYFRAGDFDAASDELLEGIWGQVGDVDLMVAHLVLNEFLDTTEAVRRRVSLHPEDYNALLLLARMDRLRGDVERAGKLIESALAVIESLLADNPENAYLLSRSALAIAEFQDPEVALARVGSAQSQAHEDPQVHMNLATVLYKAGRKNDALEELRRSLEMEYPIDMFRDTHLWDEYHRHPELADLLKP